MTRYIITKENNTKTVCLILMCFVLFINMELGMSPKKKNVELGPWNRK